MEEAHREARRLVEAGPRAGPGRPSSPSGWRASSSASIAGRVDVRERDAHHCGAAEGTAARRADVGGAAADVGQAARDAVQHPGARGSRARACSMCLPAPARVGFEALSRGAAHVVVRRRRPRARRRSIAPHLGGLRRGGGLYYPRRGRRASGCGACAHGPRVRPDPARSAVFAVRSSRDALDCRRRMPGPRRACWCWSGRRGASRTTVRSLDARARPAGPETAR